MWGKARQFWRNDQGTVAPMVALSLVALIAVGGIAFDYSHMAGLHTELQQAADQAALAAATQLDGQPGAIARATAAAQNLITNTTYLANDGGSRTISVPTITFCSAFDDTVQDTATACTATTSDSAAKEVWVKVGGRSAVFALTPIVGAISSGTLGGEAVASLSSAICKTPPVMMCNPAEPNTNTDVNLAYTPVRGIGLRLVTGDATVPGNFGWLQGYDASGNTITGANNLKEELGYNTPIGTCIPANGVTTKTGMDTTVLDAFNTRFDVYANGNACPGSGTCSPAMNTRKDLVCAPNNSNTACKSNATWAEASNPYHPTSTSPIDPATGTYPSTMGYPMDLCHAVPKAQNTCGIQGDGNWDRDAYFHVNYGWDHSTWVAQLGTSNPSRFDVYTWEQTHQNVGGKGVAVPQIVNGGSEAAFSYPATGNTGTATPDRRRISIAVVNCHALNVKGQTSGVPVTVWLDSFLVQPAFQRGPNTPTQIYTDQKDIYVEIIGSTNVGDSLAKVVRRDRPYLIR